MSSFSVELGLVIAIPSGVWRGCRHDTRGPGVVLMCALLWLTSRWIIEGRVNSGNLAKRSSGGVLLPLVFTLGNRVDAAWADADK